MKTQIIPYSIQKINISPDSRVFLGEGLFETMRVINQKAFYPRAHWNRMRRSAQQLKIPFQVSFEDWASLIDSTLKDSGLTHGGVKLILASGAAPRGLACESSESYLWACPFEHVASEKPMVLLRAPWLRDKKNPIYSVKSINYYEAISGQRFARDNGADELLYFNMDLSATETNTANFFLIKDNIIYTPAANEGLLPGIIRNKLLELCPHAGLTVIETEIKNNLIEEADIIFLTNSIIFIKPVTQIDDRFYKTAHPLLAEIINKFNTFYQD